MGESIIITGAAKGLGRVASEVLLESGYHVILLDSDEGALKVFDAELSKKHDNVSSYNLDVSHASDCERVFEEIFNEISGPIHLLNNAGITRDSMMHKMTESDFDSVIDVNLKGVHNCGQQFAIQMTKSHRQGSIVNITSVAYLGNIGQSNYAASKAGVVALTRTWAMELAGRGIRVNAIAPGLMNTDMIKSIPAKVMDKLLESVPLARVGEPNEFAKLVRFLVSEDSSYLTGQVIHLDGGLTIGSI